MRISELINLRQNKKRLDNIRKNRRNIVPFVGAGISASCGLFTWNELLDTLAAEYMTCDEREQYKETQNHLGYAEEIVKSSGNPDAVMRRIGEIFEDRNVSIGKAPYLLVSSFGNNIVTTNYDVILETAAKKFGNKAALEALLPCLTGQMTTAIQDNKRCLLKMHGSVEEISSIVFSRSQYNEFYGEGKPLPMFLETFFSGRTLLFVGCSLAKDRTMEVLAKCINRNSKIRHYAIVELPKEPDEEVRQRNYLASMGIDPIYYPKGEYESVDLLLEYLAEDNSFIKEAKKILGKYITADIDGDSLEDTYKILISILNESYYNTAKDYPELLELNGEYLDIVRDYEAAVEAIEEIEKRNVSLYDICISLFGIFSRTGIKSAQDIKESLSDYFAEAALRETDIREILQKRHALHTFQSLDIEGKTNEELTKIAEKLNQNLQFENEMGFRYFMDYYSQAVVLLDKAYEKIEMHQRVLLCNSVGAWGTYVLNPEKSKKYLGLAISTIESLDKNEQPPSLLSQCYCNLALLMARDGDYIGAMAYAEKDMRCKRRINDNARLYAGSMGHYALYQKECDPFLAIQTHIGVIKLKEKNIDNADILRYERDKNVDIKEMKKKLTASWATSVFDLGLLAKDLSFFQLANDFIRLANEYRYKIVDKVSKDYNTSCNVEAELAVLLHHVQDIHKYIDAVEGRINMNDKLSVTLYHSWYICALYFYGQNNYDEAKHYIRKFYKDFYFRGDVPDKRQEVRVKILEARILLKCDSDISVAQAVLDEAIAIIKKAYSDDSFWLVELYTLYENINNRYSDVLNGLKERYVRKRENANILLERFAKEVIVSKPALE